MLGVSVRQNEELRNLYAITYIIRVITSRRMRWEGHAYKILVGNSEGKRPLGRLGHKQEDNTEMDLSVM
jgi:hypothetical protein